MTAKEYLMSLSEMKEELRMEKEMRQEYLDMAASTSIRMDEVRVQCSRSDNGRVERYGTLAADLSRKIEQVEFEYYEHQYTIIQQIRELREILYIQLLYKVYVQFKSIRRAAKEMGMAYNYIIKKHGDALEKFNLLHRNAIADWEKGKVNHGA